MRTIGSIVPLHVCLNRTVVGEIDDSHLRVLLAETVVASDALFDLHVVGARQDWQPRRSASG
jgi:hypothetical protein